MKSMMTFLYIILAVNLFTWITMYLILFKTSFLEKEKGAK